MKDPVVAAAVLLIVLAVLLDLSAVWYWAVNTGRLRGVIILIIAVLASIALVVEANYYVTT